MMKTNQTRIPSTSSASDFDKAKDVAYRFLSYRARTVYEIQKKLEKCAFNANVIDEVIERLKNLGLLNDEQFAYRRSVDLLQNRGYGAYYISNKLKEAGIEETTVVNVLNKVFSEYNEKDFAKKAALKKYDKQTMSPKAKARMERYLGARGYSWEIIKEVIREIDDINTNSG